MLSTQMSSDNQGQLSPNHAKSWIYQPNKVCVTDKKNCVDFGNQVIQDIQQHNKTWLVVQCAHLETYEFVNGKDYP